MKPWYTDVTEEYQALRESCGLVDYEGAALLRVTGPGAAAFLGEVSSRSVDFLLEGQISTALALAEDGTVVAELLVHRLADAYLVEVWPAQADAVRAHLSAAASGRDDVAVEDVSAQSRVLGVEGPESFRVAQKFLPFPIPSMAYRSFETTTWDEVPILLSRSGVTGEYGYKLHVEPGSAERVRQELLGLGARECGVEALDIARMEMRFANLEREGGGEPFTPFDLGIQWMVDFGHEFTGRDALQERAGERARLPVCWSGQLDATPAAGTPVSLDGDEVGTVVHAVHSPSLDRVIGTARVDAGVAASGVEYEMGGSGGAEGSEDTVTTVSAPFLVATSFGIPLE